MTLIELLVVIVILTTVVAAAIPIMAPANVDRQLRETTRGLNTMITSAQARAIATGRPFGIALKRLAQETDNDGNLDNAHDDNGVCLEVFYVEEQPPFSGFSRDSMACIALDPVRPGNILIRFVTRGETPNDRLPPGWDADLFPPNTIRVGDVVEFGKSRFVLIPQDVQTRGGVFLDPKTGFYGKFGTFQQPQAVTLSARPINDTGQQINPVHDDQGNELGTVTQANRPYWTRPAPYKILRQGTITSDEPFQLPEGTAIDLRASGVGSGFFFHNPDTSDLTKRVNNSRPVFIMFSPEGSIARVTFQKSTSTSSSVFNPDHMFDEAVVDNVYLLVGRRQNIPALPVSGPNADPTLIPSGLPAANAPNRDQEMQELKEPINWLNADSRWVVIGSQSGRIVTIENAFVDPSTLFGGSAGDALRNQQILAAREFTSEMSQLGGR